MKFRFLIFALFFAIFVPACASGPYGGDYYVQLARAVENDLRVVIDSVADDEPKENVLAALRGTLDRVGILADHAEYTANLLGRMKYALTTELPARATEAGFTAEDDAQYSRGWIRPAEDDTTPTQTAPVAEQDTPEIRGVLERAGQAQSDLDNLAPPDGRKKTP